jgi:putative transposase
MTATITRAPGHQAITHFADDLQHKFPVQAATASRPNGSCHKTTLVLNGKSTPDISHDQLASLEPALAAKHLRDLSDFDVQVVRLYAHGTSIREIQRRLFRLYGQELPLDLIAAIIDEFIVQAIEWRSRPLDAMYPIIYFDALRLKIWNGDSVTIKAVYLAIGVDARGHKDVLGLWIERTVGVSTWLKVLNDMKNRGCQDVLITVMDGLHGFREAIRNVFPHAQIQTCIVHLIRSSLTM